MKSLFVIGAQRSGTSYLYNILGSHPQICMAEPLRPEPKFFLDENEYKKGREYYESIYFNQCDSTHEYLGEKSTSYIEDVEVAHRIKSYYENAKIIIMLREPAARAYSNYRFSVDNKLEDMSFKKALENEKDRLKSSQYVSSVNPFAYQKRGEYINYINMYLKVFDKSQIKVLIFEEFISNIEEITSLYNWLGLQKGFVPDDYNHIINAGNKIKNDDVWLNVEQELKKVFYKSNVELEKFLNRTIPLWK